MQDAGCRVQAVACRCPGSFPAGLLVTDAGRRISRGMPALWPRSAWLWWDGVMTRYDPDKHHHRSIRLKGYDYTQMGSEKVKRPTGFLLEGFAR